MSSQAASLPASDSAFEEQAYAKVFRRVVPLIIICYIVAYLDRINVGFAKLQMEIDLGFSQTVYGLGAGMFFIGYFFFEVPSNLIMYRVGARLWIARIMITWGLLSMCFVFVKTPFWFYTLRFLLGAAEAGFYPGVILYLTYWYPDRRRAAIVATFMAAIPIAGIFGNPLSGWIMDGFDQVAGMRGWQWMFIIEAIPAVILGIVVMFCLYNGIREATWLTEDEKLLLERNIEAEASTKKKEPSLAWRCLYGPPRVDDECDLFLLRDGPIRPYVLDADAGEGYRREGQLHDRPPERHSVPRSGRRHDLVRAECRQASRAALASDHSGTLRSCRLRSGSPHGGQYRYCHHVPLSRRRRRPHMRPSVLVTAYLVLARQRRCSGHRSD